MPHRRLRRPVPDPWHGRLDRREVGDRHRVPREQREVVRGGDVPWRIQTVRVREVRIGEPQTGDQLVHPPHERGVGARELAADRQRGVVAGGEHQAVEQVLQREPLARNEAHDRAAAHPAAVDRDLHAVIEVTTLQRDQRAPFCFLLLR